MAKWFTIVSERKTGKGNKVWRIFKRLIFGILSLVLLFLISAAVIVFFFEDEVTEFALRELNKQLKTEIKTDDIELSLIKKFPYASLEFKNVSCQEVHSRKKKENLFTAKSLFLQFNIWDIFYENYTIKKITLKEAELNLYKDRKGLDNWHFWKETTDTAKKDFAFKLSSVSLYDVHFKYRDDETQLKIGAMFKKMNLSGKFSDEKFKLSTEAEFVAEEFISGESSYASGQKIKVSTTIDVNSVEKIYTIKYGALSIEDLNLKLSGGLQKGEGDTYFTDFDIKGENLSIRSALSLLPEEFGALKENYNSEGTFYFEAKIKGPYDKIRRPEMNALFGIQGGKITHIPSGIQMHDVNFDGKYGNGSIENPNASFLEINHFKGNLKESHLRAQFKISNFNDPQVSFKTDSQINLKELFEFFPIDTLENISGNLNLKMSFEGKAGQKEFSAKDYRNSKVNGVAVFETVYFKLKQSKKEAEGISGKLIFNNNDAELIAVSGFYSGSDFLLNGKASNLIAYLLKEKEALYITANLTSRIINAERLFEKENPTKSEEITHFVLPNNLSLDLEANIGFLKFNKFEATEIQGSVFLNNRILAVENLSAKSLDGIVKVNGIADNRDTSGIQITGTGSLGGVNIRKMFSVFDNFGQNSLEEKHISGILDCKFELAARFSDELKVSKPSIIAKADFTLEKGELINFEPLEKLSSKIDIEELTHIKFSQITNSLAIYDEKIVFPEMQIRSNALDLNVQGEQSFAGDIDYRFNLQLFELLANKFRSKRNRQEEFGDLYDTKGPTRLFIRMYGNINDPKFNYDTKLVIKKLQNDWKAEKINIPATLQTEFLIIKNDSILKKDPWLKQRFQRRDSIRKKTVGTDDFEFD